MDAFALKKIFSTQALQVPVQIHRLEACHGSTVSLKLYKDHGHEIQI